MKKSELQQIIKEEISKVLKEEGNAFTEGDRVKVITPKSYNYYGTGRTGNIIEVAPSGLFYLVKFGDGSVAYYHESDLSLLN